MISSLPLQYLLPPLLLGGAWTVSRLLGIALWSAALLAAAPLAVAYFDLPWADGSASSTLATMAVLWCGLIVFLIGRAIARFAGRGVSRSRGALSPIFTIGMWCAALLVAAIYLFPDLLNRTLPGWESSLGLVLLVVGLLAAAGTLARVARSMTILTFWFFIALTIGTEVFLKKLPHEVFAVELQELREFIPEDISGQKIAERLGQYLSSISPKGEQLRILNLGSVTSGLVEQGYSFMDRLKSRMESISGGRAIEMIDLSASDLSSLQSLALLKDAMPKLNPDVVIMSAGLADSLRNSNPYGIEGLSESEARSFVESRQFWGEIPMVESIAESRLLSVTRFMLGSEQPSSMASLAPPRVLPEEYRAALSEMIALVKGGSAVPVLLPQPVDRSVRSEDVERYEGLLSELQGEGAVLAKVDSSEASPLFVGATQLSPLGHARLSDQLFTLLREVPDPRHPEQKLLGTGPEIVDSHSVVMKSSEITGDILLSFRIPEAGSSYYKVNFAVNDKFVADRRLNGAEPSTVRFSLPAEYRALPAVKLTFTTMAAPPDESDRIGSSDFFAPIPLRIVSSKAGERAAVELAAPRRIFRHDSAIGSLALALDPRDGSILDRVRFNNSADEQVELGRWIRRQPWGTVVALSWAGAVPKIEETLRSALKYIGAAQIPESGSVAILGVTGGGSNGSIIKSSADADALLEIGSAKLRRLARFEAIGVKVE